MSSDGSDGLDDIWTVTDDDASPRSPRRPPRPPRADRTRSAPDAHPGELGSVRSRPSLTRRGGDPRRADSDEIDVVEEHDEGDFDDPHDDHDDDLDDRPEKLPRWVLVLGVIALVLALAVGSVMFWYQRQVDPPGGLGPQVELEIKRGTSASGLGNRLASNGIVRNGLLFNFWASRNKVGIHGPGVYVFNENMSYEQARAVLESEPDGELSSTGEVLRVVIPEGLTVDQIITRIDGVVPRFEADELHEVLESGSLTSPLKPADVDSWEGLLFPATYELAGSATGEDFLRMLADEMQTRVRRFDADEAVAAINERYGTDLDLYDVLKVASLVQAEAGGAAEAPKIASVIYNRLEKDSTAWTLGIDAADEYGAALEDMTPGQYRETDGPYNLRKIAGLPPTPIAAPGDYALEAAFEPADTEFMYYVLEAPGVHTFVVTDAEFQAAKQRCIAAGLGCG